MPTDPIPDVAPPAPPPPPTLDDFRAGGLAALLTSHQDTCCDDLEPVLRQAGAAREDAAGRALTLLADICSMMLVPEQPELVYRPAIVWADGRCSLGPDHLTDEQLDVLAQLVAEIDQPVLRARLADLVWFRDRRRGVRYPRMAIAAYRCRPANFDTWFTGANGDGAGWHRALQLAKQIRAQEDEDAIARTLLDAFFRAADDHDAYAPLAFLKPLWIERRADGRELDVATRLEALGRDHFAAARAFDAESCFAAATNWYRWAKKVQAYEDMKVMVARAIVLQADQGNGAIVQHHWLTKAIEAYRQVPGSAFERHGVDEAIEVLRRRREEAGRAAHGEMKTFKGPKIPIGDIAASAIRHVQGRNPLMALLAFCGIDGIADAATLRAEAEQSLREHPLAAMFGGAVIADDGRQVANRGPGAGWDAQVAEKTRDLFRMHARFIAISALVPALDQIRNEHAYRLADFEAIAERSPMVPADRAGIVAKGLQAGFAGDMVQAIHILMPQFEHMVRQVLQRAGAFTAQHDRNGLDMEVGLSALIERPQMAEQLGDDVKLAVDALMCDTAGPNLRNAVAHGLADEGLCGSAAAFYAWWLILQLVVETFASTMDGMSETEAV